MNSKGCGVLFILGVTKTITEQNTMPDTAYSHFRTPTPQI